MEPYDIVVIGAGPGGYVAAARGAQLGSRVLLVEREAAGGVCLHRGCIPTKSLLSAAGLYAAIGRAGEFGIEVEGAAASLEAMTARADKTIRLLAGGIDALLKKRGVDRLQGRARLDGPQRVAVSGADGDAPTAVQARAVILATGSAPIEPPGLEADGEHVVTSDQILRLTQRPARLVVVGAGAVGCEFASLYKMLGSEVSVIEMLPALLPGSDEDVSKEIARAFRKRRIALFLGDGVAELGRASSGVTLTLQSGKTVEADVVLVAVGRRPNVRDLGLEPCGVVLTPKGAIAVDEHGRTNLDWLYAVGDVNGLWALAHAASHQGLVAVEHALEHRSKQIGTRALVPERRIVPACVYTEPEVGAVGLTEREAREEVGDVVTGLCPIRMLGRAHASGQLEGFFKVIAEQPTGRLLGIHVVAHGASELIAAGTMALSHKATLESVARTVHAHPTFGEGLLEACEAALGRPLHL